MRSTPAPASKAEASPDGVKPAVLLTRRVPSSVLARLEATCDVDLYKGASAIPREELLARVPGKDALLCLLTDPVDREVIAAGDRLRVIANIAVGYDNVDVAFARARGIAVTNTPDVLTEATAEFTWALILAATRRVAEGERVVRRGKWKGWALDYMLGMELRGKQLGIVGLGRIGAAVAARAPAFGMAVAAFSLAVTPPPPSRSPLPVPGVKTMSLDELLRTSDVVSLHVPLTPETRHLIDRTALDADEALRIPGEHRAGARRGRGGPRLGARGAADRRRRPRRLRARAGGSPGPALTGQRRVGATSRERDHRNAHRDGGPCREQRAGRPRRPLSPDIR